ncbi:MAG TPA: hypothetical protein VF665_17565 [Longimicrobium sp.]|jgi:hypothetical protein|uniref:hypothetical protein n=1 Tax=Longimicrobium sp. TaxID=2029185 RepID=UPI002EDB7624
MKLRTALSALVILAGAAACEHAPTAAVRAESARPGLSVAPVANIKLVAKKPMSNDPYGSDWFFRFDFNASGSYDPDGGSVTYYWASSCVYVPNSYAYTARVDVQPGDTCLVDLYVTDSENLTSHDQVTVNSNGQITY